jgi:shikimate kinase/3-dehydroquinate synthase
MRLFLSGPMGSGKTSVARAIARRTGRALVDLDANVAERAGASIEEIFRSRGEAAFRALEREELERVLTDGATDAVVALGGGTVVDARSRRAVLADGTLVTLTAPAQVLAARVAAQEGRPLLAGDDARAVLAAILAERADAYAECHGTIDGSAMSVDEIAERVLETEHEAPVVVPLGARTYRVEVGAGIRGRVVLRAALASAGTVVVVTDDGGASPWAGEIARELRASGRSVALVALRAGEANKTLASAERVWDAALAAGVDRGGLVIAVGGGMAGDVAGFAASTLLRGVAFAQVPTTLLAMVDSSVGGKTGIDRPEGKNLVGTFHQPRFVLADVETLATLPAEERVAGLAEVVKAAWLDGEGAVAALERDAEGLCAGEVEPTVRAVRAAVKLKARIVADDERESGPRRLLNLGHTVGHALEAAAGFSGLRHGEAVAIGLVAAFRVARSIGRGELGHEERLVQLLERLGLPTQSADVPSAVRAFVGADKKRTNDRIHFVAPAAPGDVEVVAIHTSELIGALTSGH